MRRIDAFADAVLADLAARDARQERGLLAAEQVEFRSQCDIHDDHSTQETAQKCVELRRAAEVGYTSPRAAAASQGVAGLVRNLAAGMTAAESWDRYAARQFMDRVHRRLIAWSLEEGVDAGRWTALLGARAIVASAIMELSR